MTAQIIFLDTHIIKYKDMQLLTAEQRQQNKESIFFLCLVSSQLNGRILLNIYAHYLPSPIPSLSLCIHIHTLRTYTCNAYININTHNITEAQTCELFHSLYGWVICHCVYVVHLRYPFIFQWTLKLLPCLDYCKQHRIEQWGVQVFFLFDPCCPTCDC